MVTRLKTLYAAYDKEKLSALPRVAFAGRIVVIFTESEAQKAVDYLLAQPCLGVDTETRPVFRRGQHHDVSLLQVATHEICFLFRLNLMGMTPSILRLLTDKVVPKIGISLKDDFAQLQRRAPFEIGYFIDLQHLMPKLGIRDMSLQKLFANFFGQKISKAQRLSNWDVDVLLPQQQQYAAVDAWACLVLYEEAIRLQQLGQYTLIEAPVTLSQGESISGSKSLRVSKHSNAVTKTTAKPLLPKPARPKAKRPRTAAK